METKQLKKQYRDLVIAKLKMDSVLSRRCIEEKMQKAFGHTIVRIEYSGKNVTVASSTTYGEFIKKLVPGSKVIMTGGEVDIYPEWVEKQWTVSTFPVLMCGEMVCWLEGFCGSYSCEMLKIVE